MRICQRPTCKKPFERNHKKQIYCSDRCRQAAWQEKHRGDLAGRFQILPKEDVSVSTETLQVLDHEWSQANADRPGHGQ